MSVCLENIMAHYALLNSDNVVEEVITGVDETNDLPEGVSSWEEAYTNVTGKTAKEHLTIPTIMHTI